MCHLTYSSSTCFSLVMDLFHSFFTSSFTSISQGKFWLQRLCRILLPSSANGAAKPSGLYMELIIDNIVLLVKDVLSTFILKEKESSAIFLHIPNALSVEDHLTNLYPLFPVVFVVPELIATIPYCLRQTLQG